MNEQSLCQRSFAVLVVLASMATASHAAVTGTLHINSSSQRSAIALVPDVVGATALGYPSISPVTLTFQQSVNDAYGRSATTMMAGSDGTLSAYARSELHGIPPAPVSDFYHGLYSEAVLYGNDFLTPQSDTLANGASVPLTFDLDVNGTGRGNATYNVYRINTGGSLTGVLSLSYNTYGNGVITGNQHGSFVGLIGTSYSIQYTLSAIAGVDPYGMTTAASMKIAESDYFHTLHVYATPDSSAVTLMSNSGHDYTLPVPEPASAGLLLVGLAMLLHRRRQRK